MRKGFIAPAISAKTMSQGAAVSLSYLEKRVLLTLGETGKATPADVQKAGKFRELVEVMNAASWLQAKGLVSVKERMVRYYGLARKQWATKNLPERVLLKALNKLRGSPPLDELRMKSGLDEKDFTIALGWARKKGWLSIDKVAGETKVTLADKGRLALTGKEADEALLQDLGKSELPEEAIDPQVLRMLKGRQEIIREREAVRREISLTAEGEAILRKGVELKEEVAQLTPNLLSTGKWRKVEIRPYDVTAFAPSVYPGKHHPLARYIDRVRQIFLRMGFTEMTGDFVQPSFWVYDALFQPQDHPARDMLDTFYLEGAGRMKLPEDSLVARIAEVHQSGGGTGSTGWGYSWQRNEAERAVLRSHTTPLSVQYLYAHPNPPVKAFSVGRSFRRDALDATHLPEFYQVEGIIMEEAASLGMLIGTIKEFYRQMGAEGVRVRPGYFPYTEPSLEPEVLFGGEWMELGGAGIFRPEVTAPLGVTHPVLAWGLGLERLVMALEGIKDIRELYLSDIDWLRRHPLRP